MLLAPISTASGFQSLARGLVEADTVAAVASEVQQATLELFDWDAFIFSERIDGTDEFLRVTAWDTVDGARFELDPEKHPPSPYRTAPELHRGEPMLIEADEAAQQPLNRFGDESRLSASLLFAPIHYRGTLHGICSVQSYAVGRYDRSDLAALARLCETVAPALGRARAERQLAAKLKELAEAGAELRRSAEHYRMAIACAGGVAYERDFGRPGWPRMDEGLRELTGYGPEEFSQELWQRICLQTILRGELAGLSLEEGIARIRSGAASAWKADSLVVCKDGKRRWISDSAVLVRNDDGTVKGTLGMLQDVTERVASLRLHEALSSLGQLLSGATTPRDVALAAARVLDEVFGWDAFFLDIHDGRTGLASSVVNFDTVDGERHEVASTFRGPTPPSSTFRWVLGRGPLLIRDATRSSEGRPASILYGDTRKRSASLMFVPVRCGDNEVVGMISLQSYAPARYSQEDLDMLVLLSAQCGSALYRTLAEQASRKAQSRAAVFGSLAHRLTHATDARGAGAIIAEEADRLLGWDACFFDLYDARTDTIAEMLNMDTVDGRKTEVLGLHATGTPTGSERRVLAEGAFILHQDAKRPAESCLEMFGDVDRPSACLMFAPARNGAEIVAFLSVQSYTPGAYTEDDLATLQALADHCAGALGRIRLEEAIRLSNERFALAALAANDGLWDWNIATGRAFFSSRCRAILDCEPDETTDVIEAWTGHVHADDRADLEQALRGHLDGRTESFEHEHRLNLRNGSHRWIEARGIAVRAADGTALRMVGSLTDISVRKAAEVELVESAFHDHLTGLANRALFSDRLEQCFHRARRDASVRFAVMFLDLDRFKAINDTYGHAAGDRLLAAVAHRLRRQFRPTDTVARMGGDEFTVLVEQYRTERDLAVIASRVIADLSAPFQIDGVSVRISASIGIATSEHGYDVSEGILRDADAALYRAKEAGKARFEIFDRGMRDSVVAAMETETAIREALERREFVLHYQPIIRLATREVVGFEALVRWRHPARGLLAPSTFIPVAEDTPLIHGIGEQVLDEACRQIAHSRPTRPAAADCYVSVNVSPRQFQSPTIAQAVEDALARHGIPGDALRIEITETALLKDPAAVRPVLERWRRAGVRVMLDDFGTGYSSLSHLDHFAVDSLKIDRSFVGSMDDSADSQRVVRAVVSLGAVLGIQVVAEGAETPRQCDLLRAMECDFAQGYYFSKPLPPEEAERIHLVGGA